MPTRSGYLNRPPELVPALGPGTDYVLVGSDAGSGVTSLALTPISIPVPKTMTAIRVAASWLSDTIPAGDWTATLERRPAGGTWTPVATFTVRTS